MSDTGNIGGGRSLPEDIAGRAGLPRETGVEHSLHAPGGPGASAPRTPTERFGAPDADTNRATDTGPGPRDRVAGAAGEAKERASAAAHDVRDRVGEAKNWAADRYDAQRRRASALAERGGRRIEQGRNATEHFVAENPLLVGVVGLAAGLLLGSLLPRSRQEDQAIGSWSDELKDQGMRYAREVTSRGREFVETALDPENLDAAVRRGAGSTDPTPGPATQTTQAQKPATPRSSV